MGRHVELSALTFFDFDFDSSFAYLPIPLLHFALLECSLVFSYEGRTIGMRCV